MDFLLVAPVMWPFIVAIACFLLRRWPSLSRQLSVGGAVVQLGLTVWLFAEIWVAGPSAVQLGGWSAPFGITFVADLLAAVMVLITGIVCLAVAAYSLADVDEYREQFGFHALFHCLIAGVTGAFLTGDLFNLYVWFEVMLISSFGLLVLGGDRAQLDGGVKYVCLNLVATASFLLGVGLLYGMTGTLNMADLALVLDGEVEGPLLAVVGLLLFAFATKAAMFPLFFWLPASYHTPPVAVSAVFAALLTKVGVYALIRVMTLIFDGQMPVVQDVLIWASILTMVTGVLGAAAQNQIRRILSFHIISQIGYMTLGLALFTPLAIIGALFYLVHHIVVKANLFLVAGVANRMAGSFELGKIGGLVSRPWLAVLFLIPALSLAGIPPLSGFWAKLLIIQASLEAEHYAAAVASLLVGLLTVYSMGKIWLEAFWKPHPEEDASNLGVRPDGTAVLQPLSGTQMLLLVTPIVALAAITVVIGLWAEPFNQFALAAADQLLSPDAYVQAVLGGR